MGATFGCSHIFLIIPPQCLGIWHIIVKNALFSAETQRKSYISAGYKNIFAIFAAVFNRKEKFL